MVNLGDECHSIEDCNEQYRLLWKEYIRKIKDGSPLGKYLKWWPQQYVPDKMEKRGILFISINPGLNENAKGAKDLLKINGSDDLDNKECIDEVINYHRGALTPDKNGKLYPYYEALKNIAYTVNPKCDEKCWCNIDLIPVRGKKQNEVKEDLQLNKPINKIDDGIKGFVKESTMIANKIIQVIEPKVVVVVNALISGKIIERWGGMGRVSSKNTEGCFLVKDLPIMYDDENFKNEGYRTIKVGRSDVPLFLSGMVSGGGLDRTSRERLIWHIRKVMATT